MKNQRVFLSLWIFNGKEVNLPLVLKILRKEGEKYL